MAERSDSGSTVINARRVLLFLPAYVVWVVAIDLLFESADRTNTACGPLWMVVGFAVAAVSVAAVVLWYLLRCNSGQIPQNGQHTYMALLAGIVVSGFGTDALKGLAAVILGGYPWWLLVAISTAGYAICWVVIALTMKWQSHPKRLSRNS
jgi:hypothetical protein